MQRNVQTLGLNAQRRAGRNPGEKEPFKIGLPLSLLVVPVLFIAAGLSIPYALAASRIQRRRERAFRLQMKKQGRTIEWGDFVRAMDECRGTMIWERRLKGPSRWWWTPENVYGLCPYPIVVWIEKLPFDEIYRPLATWCRERYTRPDDGRAVLVDLGTTPDNPMRSVLSGLESGSIAVAWIEVAPLESFRRKELARDPSRG